jgi:hypothetical protein
MLKVMNSLAGLSGASGLQTSMRAFDRSATLVSSSVGLASTAGAGLIDGLTGLSLAAVSAKANLAVMRGADATLGSIIDLRA